MNFIMARFDFSAEIQNAFFEAQIQMEDIHKGPRYSGFDLLFETLNSPAADNNFGSSPCHF